MDTPKPSNEPELSDVRDCVQSTIDLPVPEERRERLQTCVDTWGQEEVERIIAEWEIADSPQIAGRGQDLRKILEEIQNPEL